MSSSYLQTVHSSELNEMEEMLLDAFRSTNKTKRRLILQKTLEIANE